MAFRLRTFLRGYKASLSSLHSKLLATLSSFVVNFSGEINATVGQVETKQIIYTDRGAVGVALVPHELAAQGFPE